MSVNSIRFSGLASGIDTDSMVKALLSNEQLKIDRQKQQQTLLGWRKDAWKDMNNKINTFYSKYVSQLRFQATFEKNKVTVSNPSALDVDTNGNIPSGTHRIAIEEIASGAYMKNAAMSHIGEIDKTTTLAEIGIVGGEISVKGTIIKLSEIETIGKLESALKNADKSLNVNFDVVNKRFFISSKETGESAKIDITGDHLADLGLLHDGADTLQGSNAAYSYNGMPGFTSESNTVTINSITMTLKAKTSEDITINVTKDTEAFTSFIREFVDEYNKLIDDINIKIGADGARSYSPLSDEQKKSMSESDIAAWENKIKDSLFSNDPQLKALRNNMRSILSDSEQGRDIYKTLANIGITTGNWKEMGKLHINENKLRTAINENADAVVELFVGGSVNGTPVRGIGTKLNASFQSMIKGITNTKSYSSYYNDIIDRQKLTDVNKKIDKLQDRYARLEMTYYAKFTAMEKALSQLNNQSSWLSQQTGGM